jgi:hypothetical protein
MAGHLFLGMPGTVAFGIVEMQMQLATADIPQLLSLPVTNRRITLLAKYTAVTDGSCGDQSILVSSFGLKKTISIDFPSLIV